MAVPATPVAVSARVTWPALSDPVTCRMALPVSEKSCAPPAPAATVTGPSAPTTLAVPVRFTLPVSVTTLSVPVSMTPSVMPGPVAVSIATPIAFVPVL